MSMVTCQISISLDGYVAGPNQSIDNPFGEGGMRLHDWVFATASWRRQQGLEGGDESADSEVAEEVIQGVGAYIMGRKMFGGPGLRSGKAGGVMSRLTTRPPSCSLTTLAQRSRCGAVLRSRS